MKREPFSFGRLLPFNGNIQFVTHKLSVKEWRGDAIKIAVLSDIHATWPWIGSRQIRTIVRQVMSKSPDLIVLAGDLLADKKMPGRPVEAVHIMQALEELSAPLGVFAVLGNHDWHDCALARQTNYARNSLVEAIKQTDVELLNNAAKVFSGHGHEFAVVGFDSQRPKPGRWDQGFHDPERAFADVPKDLPAILVAHEPDYFAQNDERAFLQISGHTHGGQVNLFGWRPIIPSQFGARYAHGLIHEKGRSLVVSGGIGYSGLPVRFRQPPEVTFVEISSAD